ncbi:MAG: cupin domain-containing protein [Micavibrio sp.]|nr:cupin domain-containing protein [Micavibrio sp.]
MILDTFPDTAEFYKTYWGKKPFIVRGAIPPDVIDGLIDGDTLAGLATEEEIKSRIITNSAGGDDWAVEHGPFDEDRFDAIGDKNWSLLVQNVEQYHTQTAELLQYFQFSPRWLLDDIMVSYSAPGGSVGPHTDSYHTFLVQGIGKRNWKISAERVDDKRYVDNPDVKVLAHGFDGETFEVHVGDVIYMPPFFGHEGKTLEAAMTFSVGFLGPKLSEMLGDYAHYLEENEELNARYLGDGLNAESAGYTLGNAAQGSIRDDVISSIQSDNFNAWMAGYFSAPSHEEIEDSETSEEGDLSAEGMRAALQTGAKFYKPEHVKIAITTSSEGAFNIAVCGKVLCVCVKFKPLLEKFNAGEEVSLSDFESANDQDEAINLLTALYYIDAIFMSNFSD